MNSIDWIVTKNATHQPIHSTNNNTIIRKVNNFSELFVDARHTT